MGQKELGGLGRGRGESYMVAVVLGSMYLSALGGPFLFCTNRF